MPQHSRQDISVPPSEAERRQYGRIRQGELYCSLGEVEDLSAGGMRLRCRRVPRGQLKVALRSKSGVEIEVYGTIAWRRRIGIGKHVVGVRFTGLTPEIMQKLTRIATEHRLNSVMRLGDNHLIS